MVTNEENTTITKLPVFGSSSATHKTVKFWSDTTAADRNFKEAKSIIDRFYPSSKTCSSCGWKKEDLTLSDRIFKCEKCGIEIDRDLNAALNIKRIGVDILYNRIQRDEIASLDEVSRTE